LADEPSPNQLERLLRSAAEDPAERPAFAQAILASEVYVLGSLDQATVGGVAQEGTNMRLVTWADQDGPITPFFTSEAALQQTISTRPGTDPHFLRLRGRDLFQMVRGQRLVLNPDGPSGKVYLPSEVEDLLEGREHGVTTHVVQKERRVLVGAAAHMPPDLPMALARFFTQRPVVEAAHLGWIAHPDEGHEGYLLVVVSPEREMAMAGFGSLQISELTGGETVDVLVIGPGERNMLADVEPFYVRQPQADLPTAPKRRGFFRK
jgi:hypothetical protein